MSDWIQTYSGGTFAPLSPRAEDVRVEDIAHALSMLCRFAGHVDKFYSVAQHCVLVSRYCDEEDALWGLCHDAPEAYLVDVPRPVKHDPRFAFYRAAELNVMRSICDRIGLPYGEPTSVQRADKKLLVTEARDLLKHVRYEEWQMMFGQPYEDRIIPWTPARAEREWIKRYRQLGGSLGIVLRSESAA